MGDNDWVEVRHKRTRAGRFKVVSTKDEHKIKLIVAFDVENYIRRNLHVREAEDALLTEEDLSLELLVDVGCRLTFFYPMWTRLAAQLGKLPNSRPPCASTEWQLACYLLVWALGGVRPADAVWDAFISKKFFPDNTMKQLYSKLRRVGRTLRERVREDFVNLAAYKGELANCKDVRLGKRGGLAREEIHVELLGDERPLGGKDRKARRLLEEQKLREFVEEGLIAEDELTAFLEAEREARVGQEEPPADAETLVSFDGTNVDEVFRGLSNSELARLLASTDTDFTLPQILRAALEDTCRREIEGLGPYGICRRKGVKGESYIAEMARQLKPRTLVIVSDDTDCIQAWQYPSVVMQLKVDGSRMAGSDYGLEECEYGLPFLFKCALLGKRRKAKGQDADPDHFEVVNLVGGPKIPTGVYNKDAIGKGGMYNWAREDSEPRYRNTFERFSRQASGKKAWRLGLDGILKWLLTFKKDVPSIRCRFLSRVLNQNIVVYPEAARGPRGKMYVLNLHEGDADEYEDTVFWDVDGILTAEDDGRSVYLKHLRDLAWLGV